MKNLILVETVTVNDQEIQFKTDGSEIYTDSLTVARVFGKRHDHVLRDIDEEISLPKIGESVTSGFTAVTYLAKNLKQEKMYYLTRDQFTLLVMGFTGAKARAWKIEYISAFNKVVESHRGLTVKYASLLEDYNSLLTADGSNKKLLPILRKEVDYLRRDNFKYLKDYFLSNGKNGGDFNHFQIKFYESIYLIVTGKVANNLLLERFESGIQSFNSGHNTISLADYTTAFNYLNQKEMVAFMKIYDCICAEAVEAIENNPKATPDLIIDSIKTKLSVRIQELRGITKGTLIKRKDKLTSNNLVEKTILGKLPKEEFNNRRASLKAGQSYRV